MGIYMKKGKIKFRLGICLIIIAICIFLPVTSYAEEIEEEFTDEELVQEIKEVVVNLGSGGTASPNINSRAGIVMDRKTGAILYEKNLDQVRKMASTTKIMTCIVAIEEGNLSDVVTISKRSGGTGGSTMGLKEGDTVTLNDLLYGLMLPSGNDAAVAIAEHIGGNVEGFAELMNKKVKELGLENTNFVTPHGLDSDGHYTTVYELAVISNYALDIPLFGEIAKTKNKEVKISGNTKELRNTNELLGYLDGVYGVKTGFTNGANRCLVTSVKRGNLDLICVVLGADTKKHRTRDSINLIEYSFKNYKQENLEENINNNFNEWKLVNEKRIVIEKGIKDNPSLKLGEIEYKEYVLKIGDIDKIDFEFSCIENVEAPIKANEVFGRMDVKLDGQLLYSVDILNEKDIEKKKIKDYLRNILTNMSSYNLKAVSF